MIRVRPLLAVLLSGCVAGGSPGATSPPPPPAHERSDYDPSRATASIRVHARLDGVAPRMRRIRVEACPTAAAENPEPIFLETVVARDGNLANVVVWTAEGGDGWTFTPPSDPVSMDATGTVLRPHVATLQVGQPLRILNRGRCHFHGHLVATRNRERFALLPPRTGEVSFRFDEEEVGMKLMCDVHGWTSARVSAFDHPFHGVTGEDGEAELRLPPGAYTLAAWHEKLAAPAPLSVTLAAGETRDLEFVFRAE